MKEKKILIIEDDVNLSINLMNFLNEEGFLTKSLSEAANAIESARSWKPDLIICDVNLPHLNGFDLREKILEDKSLSNIPFIFLTAKVEKENFRRGMQLAADDYIFKPFDLDDLLLSIRIRFEKIKKIEADKFVDEDSNGKLSMDKKILIKFGSKMEFCSLRDLKYIKSENPYVSLNFSNGKNTLIREPLESWDKKLPSENFLRIYKSCIINKDFVTKIEQVSKSTFVVRLKDENEPFFVSRRYSSTLKKLIV